LSDAGSKPDPVQAIYDWLWADALATFATGRVKTDPHLLDRAADDRRGLSLIIRPAPDMIARMTGLIDRLRQIAPDQHLYRPDELHITLLALLSATSGFDLGAVPVAAYRDLLADLFAHVRPFEVHFTGVTASPDCVMICGHSEGDALNVLRDRLREALAQAGLGTSLDRRYRIVTAHATILRFYAQPANLPALVAFLTSLRDHDLGTFRVEQVEFVTNDWYMSHDRVQVLARYPLAQCMFPV
jgi:2'-5' RNA ligase